MYFLYIGLILFCLYIGLETIKQTLYFQPDTNCDDYTDDYENVFFECNSYTLHGLLYLTEESEKIILYCHGNAGNIGHRLNIMNQWKQEGYSIFMFDYPGYGLSKGNPSEKSLYQSGEEALKYLLKTKKKKNIILYGESIGCSVASYLATTFNIDKLILQSGFISMKEVAKDYLPSYCHLLLFIVNEFNTYQYLSKFNGKLMILHSKEDEIIFFRHAEQLKIFSTEFIEIQGTHNEPMIDYKKLIKFID